MSDVLRSKKTSEEYKAVRESRVNEKSCALCGAEPLESFDYWKIIANSFPYDKIAATHNMVVPKRHVRESEINQEEWLEYQKIKLGKIQEYEYILEATDRVKSIPAHFHLHLIISKKTK